jgi:hypothetical protein
MDSTLYTQPYTGRQGIFALPDHVRWLALPIYPGVTDDGQSALEERVTVVLADAPGKFWPLVVKMSLDEAEQLQTQLTEAIAERRRRDQRAG